MAAGSLPSPSFGTVTATTAYVFPDGSKMTSATATGATGATGPAIALSTATPAMDGAGAAGSSGKAADAGHQHPTDTSRQATLGYTPNRQTTPLSASGGQTGNIAIGSNSGIGSVSFVATATSCVAMVACSVISTAIGIQTNLFLSLVDTTTNKTLATGATSTVHSAIANGHCPVTVVLDTGGLTIGDGYSLALYAGQVSAASAGSTQVGYWAIEGLNT